MRSTPILRAALAVFSVLVLACSSASDAAPGASSAKQSDSAPTTQGVSAMTSIHDLELRRLDGSSEKLSAYAGKVLLVVNVASECGFTPQYKGLQALHEELGPKGFVVLGFPSNDFGAQEPGSSTEIASFCEKNFGVEFPMFDKLVTKGEGASELYQRLGAAAGAPKWNFHKYLVGKDGKVIQGFPSSVAPESPELRRAIDAALAQG
jgi:glutathione peroxidase